MGASSQPSTGASAPDSVDLDPTFLAATRTLFAMLRTGSVVAGGGALVTKLLAEGWSRWVVAALSSAFVALGYWIMWAALRKGRILRARYEALGKEGLFSHRQFTVMTVALQVLIATVLGLYLLTGS